MKNDEESKNFNQISTIKNILQKAILNVSVFSINAKKKKTIHLPTLNFMDPKDKK